ncbi:MAG TPA: hypothetical protein VE870_06020 [Bacteroidales bacterium]|nr:hypothetical protein [Bacteroidales bacterium]
MNRLPVICLLMTIMGLLPFNGLKAQDDTKAEDVTINREIAAFRVKIEKEAINENFDKALWVNFRVDTFRIQKTLEANLQEATGRYGASFIWSDAVAAYNEMIGRYYDLLIEKMIEVDKKYLQQSQQSWLEYKQSEQILNQIVGRKQYDKTGITGRENYEYLRMVEINKDRAVVLFQYLLRSNKREQGISNKQ